MLKMTEKKEREKERVPRAVRMTRFSIKDYLKNYLDGNSNASHSWAPFCARPIEALGGAYTIPRRISDL